METQFAELSGSEQKVIIGVIRLIGFARKKKVKSIIVAGSSAQPLAKLFRALWQRLFPNERLPKFYALGTIPLVSKRKIEVMEKLVLQRFNMKKIDEPLMIMDEFTESGQTMLALEEIFRKAGKKKVYKTTLYIRSLAKSSCDFYCFEESLPPFFYKVRRNAVMRALREGRKGREVALSELKWLHSKIKRMASIDPATLKLLRRKFLH